MLCEGMVKGSANSILTACPASKDILKDKLCLGAFKENILVAFVDLIKNYPSEGVLTIGYLLVHPSCQSIGLGSRLIEIISQWALKHDFTKLRLGAQEQNGRALSFWQKNSFSVIKTIEEKLESRTNQTYVLERSTARDTTHHS